MEVENAGDWGKEARAGGAESLGLQYSLTYIREERDIKSTKEEEPQTSGELRECLGQADAESCP